MKSFRIYSLTATLAILSVVTGYDYNDKEVGYLRSLDANWARHAGRDVELKQCVPIPKSMGLCRNVGYANMSLPNLLGHIRVEEVVRQAQPWVPLYNVRCHPNTDLFLCSLYAPVCLDRHIFPCRSLCEAVKKSCEIRMNNYGFKWPEILECERFPLDDDLCIKQINFSNDAGDERGQIGAANVCIPCKQPITYESLLDSYCQASYVLKVKVRKIVDDKNGDKRIVFKGKRKFYKDIPPDDVKSFEPVIYGGSACECNIVEKRRKMLVMGTKLGQRYVVTYISTLSKEKEFKRAMKAITKKHDCMSQIEKIAGQNEANNGGISTSGEPLPPVDEQIVDIGGGSSKQKGGKKDKKKKKDKKDKKKKNKKKKQQTVGIGCLPCEEQTTYDNIMTRFCEADFALKTSRITQVKIDQNGDKRLIFKKGKKADGFYKKQNLSRRDLRKFQPVISGGSTCDCTAAVAGSRNLLLIGKKQGTRFVLTFLSEWGKSGDFKKASRALRKGYDCANHSNNNSPSSG